MQARPASRAPIAVLYCDPIDGLRAKTLLEPVVRQKLEQFHITSHCGLVVPETEHDVARGLQQLLRFKPSAVLVASTTAPASPDDTVGLAMHRIGCHIERFLAPVDPGSLLLIAYKDNVPILGAPSCFRSMNPNVVDVLLPPLIAQYRISTGDLARLGHGGLLGGHW